MRIISGAKRGRRLLSPGTSGKGGPLIRPTSDRAREALFNILGSAVQDAAVLDLYAGTGALGLEAMSRGASSVLFVDHERQSLKLIAHNVALCGFAASSRIVDRDLSKGLFFFRASHPAAVSPLSSWTRPMTRAAMNFS